MAADSGKVVAVVIDEFQQVVEQGGVEAERQLRAAVQRHEHVAYIFAGSKTAMLSGMTGNPDRPFYRLGSRLFVGPIPREDFRPFIEHGFSRAGLAIAPNAVEAILDLAADVPFNVQRLAHACWNEARERVADDGSRSTSVADDGSRSTSVVDDGSRSMTVADVKMVLERLVRRDDPFYTQVWNRMPSSQQKAGLALVSGGGKGLFSKAVLERYGIPLSTMRTALQGLVNAGIVREEESLGSIRYVLEDPFYSVWLGLVVGSPKGG
jgi:hypothetical protein